MKRVTLKDLKQDLSLWTSEAHKGELIQITRYNKPYVYISAGDSSAVRVGSKVGIADLRIDKSIPKSASGGKWRGVLDDDRQA